MGTVWFPLVPGLKVPSQDHGNDFAWFLVDTLKPVKVM